MSELLRFKKTQTSQCFVSFQTLSAASTAALLYRSTLTSQKAISKYFKSA